MRPTFSQQPPRLYLNLLLPPWEGFDGRSIVGTLQRKSQADWLARFVTSYPRPQAAVDRQIPPIRPVGRGPAVTVHNVKEETHDFSKRKHAASRTAEIQVRFAFRTGLAARIGISSVPEVRIGTQGTNDAVATVLFRQPTVDIRISAQRLWNGIVNHVVGQAKVLHGSTSTERGRNGTVEVVV